MVNYEKMETMMKRLGHPENLLGTQYIRLGIEMRDAGRTMLTKDIYPAIARQMDTTASRVERSIRHSIDVAVTRGNFDEWMATFGWTMDPRKGKPTVGEYLARMARECHED